jgi:hypothetical protein
MIGVQLKSAVILRKYTKAFVYKKRSDGRLVYIVQIFFGFI